MQKVTVENLETLHITRRNNKEVKAAVLLLIGGVEVGTAAAVYKTATQRLWDAELNAEINGVQVALKAEGVFSAVRITESFEEQIRKLCSVAPAEEEVKAVEVVTVPEEAAPEVAPAAEESKSSKGKKGKKAQQEEPAEA